MPKSFSEGPGQVPVRREVSEGSGAYEIHPESPEVIAESWEETLQSPPMVKEESPIATTAAAQVAEVMNLVAASPSLSPEKRKALEEQLTALANKVAPKEELVEESPLPPAEETALELKTRMRTSVLALDSLSKAQQKEMYARVFEQRTSAREAHQKEIVDLMVQAKSTSATSVAAIAEHFKKSGMIMNALRSLSLQDMLPEEVLRKRTAAQLSRHQVITRTLGTVKERRAARGGDPMYDEKVYDRYTRRYHILQDVVIKPQKEEELARMEGLSLREKGALEKAFEHISELPAPVRILTTSALLTVGGAAVMGGGMVPLLFGGAAAAASVVSGFFKKRGAGQLVSQGIASITSVTGLVGLALNYSVQGMHTVLGTTEKAKQRLERESGLEKDITDWKNFYKESERVRGDLRAEQRVKRDAGIVAALGSLATGAFIGHHISGADSPTAEQTAGTVPNPEVPGDSSVLADAHPEAISQAHQHASQEGIIGVGDGADAAFSELQSKLRVEYAGVSTDDMPPAVRTVLEAKSPNELSREFGFAWGDKSHVMQVGDSIGIEEGKLVFTHDGKEQVLMDDGGAHPLRHVAEPIPAIEHPSPVTHHDSPAASDVIAQPITEEAPVVPQTSAVEVPQTTPVAPPEAQAAPFVPRSFSPEEAVRLHDQAAEAAPSPLSAPNPFGVTIDATQPHLYSFRLPGTDQEYVSVYGGSQEALGAEALKYLKDHPDAVVLYNSPQTALDGSLHDRTDAFTLGSDGTVVPVPEYTDGVIEPGTRLNPDYFTRPIRP